MQLTIEHKQLSETVMRFIREEVNPHCCRMGTRRAISRA